MSTIRRRPILRRSPRRLAVIGTAILAILAVIGTVAYLGLTRSLLLSDLFHDPAPAVEVAADPYTSRPLYVDPAAQTVRAAAADPRFEPLAEVPQAKWFSDWSSVETVESDVRDYVQGAAGRRALPVLVLYRILDRDCGLHATGGVASAAEYRSWIDGVVRGLHGQQAVVIVEPDALGHVNRCAEGRVELLRYAVERLATTSAWVYLDAGHSNWHPATEMAELLRDAGVERIRGFSLNVSNYHPTGSELAFGRSLVAELHRLGVRERRFVIDTSRNGARVSEDEWCNALGARLGAEPELRFEGAFDAVLWIKNPAESDGPCHGGPRSGFWDQLALMLLGEPNELERREAAD